MSVWAITMVKDESDILRYTVEHMLTQVDNVLIADNMSTDGTDDVICDLITSKGGRVMAQVDSVVAYNQADKMTELAHSAGRMGATWIVPFDADEAWFLPDLHQCDLDVVAAVQYIFIPTVEDDFSEPNPLRRIQHRQATPDRHLKVAFRYHPDAWLHMGNHDVSHPGTRRDQCAMIRHYMYRSLKQARRKAANGAAAYRASNLDPKYGVHWHWLNDMAHYEQEQWWEEYINQPVVEDLWSP